MRSLIPVFLVLFSNFAEAAYCTSNWRVGQNVVRVGDDADRAIQAIDRARHRYAWLRGPSGRTWTVRESGYNSQTVRISVKNGQLTQICQTSS